MGKGRLEVFSDGVLAIIITIMVLEMEAPKGAELGALRPVVPMFLSYVLSFLYLGIYWSNRHHLLYVTHRISGAIMRGQLVHRAWRSWMASFVGAGSPASSRC